MDEFLDGYRPRGIITRYSDHISLPIVIPKEAREEEGKEGGKDRKVESTPGEETVNSATALWRRNKKDIKPEEYHEFYKEALNKSILDLSEHAR